MKDFLRGLGLSFVVGIAAGIISGRWELIVCAPAAYAVIYLAIRHAVQGLSQVQESKPKKDPWRSRSTQNVRPSIRTSVWKDFKDSFK